MLRTTACMTQQHRLLTIIITIIIIKTLEKYSELYPSHSDFSFVRKWHKQLKKIASMEVCTDFWKPIWKDGWSGWDQDEWSAISVCTSGRRFGIHPSSDGSQTGTPRADLGEASFSQRSHSTWMNYSSSFSKNQTVFKLENLSSVEKWFIRSFPGQGKAIIPPAGVGDGVGDGTSPGNQRKSYRRPYCNWRACGLLPSLQCYDLWRWDACLIWRYLLCTQKVTEKSGIRVNFLEKISLVLFFFCFVFW